MIYTTKTDAMEREILPALGEYASDHDLDAIFDRAFTWTGRGYEQTVSSDEFWEIVTDCAKVQEPTTQETLLAAAAAQLDEARRTERAARMSLADAVEIAVAGGMSKYRACKVTGLGKATVDKWAEGRR